MLEVTKSIKASYPTVMYHKCEIFTAVKVTEEELPGEVRALPLNQRAAYLDQMANNLMQQGFANEYQQVYNNLSAMFGSILPLQVEMKFMQEGKLKNDSTKKTGS